MTDPQAADSPAEPVKQPAEPVDLRSVVTVTTAVDAAATATSTAAGMAEAPPPRRRAGLPDRDRPVRVGRRSAGGGGTGREGELDDGARTAETDQESLEMARRIVDLAADKKAVDIVLLDIHTLTTVADYFVICSGGSERQLGGIADGIIEGLKEQDILPVGREGGPTAHWVLLDYGAVIVHVMAQPERDYYTLEKLWSDAPLLLRVL